jgi:hypothetical protein
LGQHWRSVAWRPKYAPELKAIETVWGDLKHRYLAHRTFTDKKGLARASHNEGETLIGERKPVPLANQRIAAWGVLLLIRVVCARAARYIANDLPVLDCVQSGPDCQTKRECNPP